MAISWWILGGIILGAAYEVGVVLEGEAPEKTWICPACLRHNLESELECALCERPRAAARSVEDNDSRVGR